MRGLPKLEPYVPVYQDKHINAYAYITPHAIAGEDIDAKLDEDGYYGISYDNTLFFFNPAYIAISGRTQQLMMYYIEKFVKAIRHNYSDENLLKHKKIMFQISEVAKEFDLTPKQARNLIIRSSTAMQMMVIQWEDTLRGKKIFHSSNIIQGFDYYRTDRENDLKRGEVAVTLADRFATLLPKLFFMWYPCNLRRIPLRHYPSANGFGVRLAVTFNMNREKSNRGRISVPELLLSTQEIPSYDKLQDGARQLQKRIVAPFVRNMDILVQYGVISGWYLELDGKALGREELKTIRYKAFKNCMVVYEMKDYPKDKRPKELADSYAVPVPSEDKKSPVPTEVTGSILRNERK